MYMYNMCAPQMKEVCICIHVCMCVMTAYTCSFKLWNHVYPQFVAMAILLYRISSLILNEMLLVPSQVVLLLNRVCLIMFQRSLGRALQSSVFLT